MTTNLLRFRYLTVFIGATVAAGGYCAEFPSPLPAESIPKVETLPAKYPNGWAFLNYAGDRIELRNVGSDTSRSEGIIYRRTIQPPCWWLTNVLKSMSPIPFGRVVCAAIRTDFITIYDTQTFELPSVRDRVSPGTKRALITAMEGLIAFTDAERMALVFNFTPASSVTVVDLPNRKVLAEIDIPGCSLVYPSGARGFATLCSSGSLLNVRLDENGKVTARSETKAFNPLDTDPLFTASASVGGVRYFPSLHGRIQPIDMKGEEVKILPDWPLVPAADAAGHWRPSGWQVLTSDDSKLLYVLMQPDAHEGTHKDPATEIWVYNAAAKSRIKRIRLARPGSSLALTHAAAPLLLVQAGERLDVYDAHDGSLQRSLDLPGLHTRMQIEPIR